MSLVVWVLATIALMGFTIFLVGFVWSGITSPKHRMSREEAIEFSQGHGAGATGAVLSRSWSRRWFRGWAGGFSWFDEMSFAELKRGFGDGRWRRDVRHMQFELLVAGFLLGLCGGVLLIGWAVGPVGLAVAAGLLAYIAVQTARGFWRA